MQVTLTHARLKEMAKAARKKLGPAAPSYQKTLDTPAAALGFSSYEALKPKLADTDAPTNTTPPTPEVAVVVVPTETRLDIDPSEEPKVFVGADVHAAVDAFSAWLGEHGANTDGREPEHYLYKLPVSAGQPAGQVKDPETPVTIAPAADDPNRIRRDAFDLTHPLNGVKLACSVTTIGATPFFLSSLEIVQNHCEDIDLVVFAYDPSDEEDPFWVDHHDERGFEDERLPMNRSCIDAIRELHAAFAQPDDAIYVHACSGVTFVTLNATYDTFTSQAKPAGAPVVLIVDDFQPDTISEARQRFLAWIG
ncbi:hypothetical protein CKO28_00605 [Rhodovibrio sodomensis]|uniref:Uncharacterized protein n=1 Tax=Rhodovibrio sodomensis TaxID=1088 RepID=A0ABS1D801_9PROT|nr:hypothetical protein [Rhodovibrio sodomensis]MBK1666541.1 hypothetical protein [Rhodovibrio sodomensis]